MYKINDNNSFYVLLQDLLTRGVFVFTLDDAKERMYDQAVRAYSGAARYYMPERARLRASGEWDAQAQSTLRNKAVYLAERTMTKELFEWVESHFANPKDWKEAVIASAVEEAKSIVKRASRRKR